MSNIRDTLRNLFYVNKFVIYVEGDRSKMDPVHLFMYETTPGAPRQTVVIAVDVPCYAMWLHSLMARFDPLTQPSSALRRWRYGKMLFKRTWLERLLGLERDARVAISDTARGISIGVSHYSSITLPKREHCFGLPITDGLWNDIAFGSIRLYVEDASGAVTPIPLHLTRWAA